MSTVVETGGEELQSVSGMREDLYRLLSALFLGPPPDELLEKMSSEDFLASLEEIFGDQVVGFFRRFAQSGQRQRTEVEQDFDDLFLVPGGRFVTPYESAFRERRILDGQETPGLLMGKATERALAF